jgi:hypothetical protein
MLRDTSILPIAKRSRVEGTASDVAVTPLQTAPITAGDGAATTTLPSTPPQALAIISRSFEMLPAEIHFLIASHLSAPDILCLSRTSKYFKALVSTAKIHHTSILNLSKALLQCGNPYDKGTQTLDLSSIINTQENFPVKAYRTYLQKVIDLLNTHPTWAKVAIKTLSFPIIFKWPAEKLTDVLKHITHIISTLSEDIHLHLLPFIPSHNSKQLLTLTSVQSEKLRQYVATLQTLFIREIAIESSHSIANLNKVLIEKGLSKGLQTLRFSSTPLSFSAVDVQFPPNATLYPYLTTLDFSQANRLCPSIANNLPNTVTCLRINGSTHIACQDIPLFLLPSVLRLEFQIDLSSKPLEYNLETLKKILHHLPALKELYLTLPSYPRSHPLVLHELINLPSNDFFITFSTLHIYSIGMFEALYAKYQRRLRLPEELVFHLQTLEAVKDFAKFILTGVFDYLKKIQYQTEEIINDSNPFAKMIKHLLKADKISQIKYFVYHYRFIEDFHIPLTIPSSFADSQEGKLMLLKSKKLFVLTEVINIDKIKDMFLNFAAEEAASLPQPSNFTVLQSPQFVGWKNTLTTIVQEMWTDSLEQKYAYTQLIHLLETVYLRLYQLTRRYIYSIYPYEIPFIMDGKIKSRQPTSFFQTSLGQELNDKLQKLMLADVALSLAEQQKLQLAEIGFSLYSIHATSTSFTITFSNAALQVKDIQENEILHEPM